MDKFLNKSKHLYTTLTITRSSPLIRKKNVCLLSGENGAVRKQFLASRFKLNSMCVNNTLQNFKINSW